MKKHVQVAERMDHPLLKEAVLKRAPPGFHPVKQICRTKSLGSITKDAEEEFGEVVVVKGHYQVFKEGGAYLVIHFKTGCIVYAKDKAEEPKGKRMPSRHGQ